MFGPNIRQICVGCGAEVGEKLRAQDRHRGVSFDKDVSERDLVFATVTSDEPTNAPSCLDFVHDDGFAEWSVAEMTSV